VTGGSPATGTMPLSSLPVLSAMSCSAQRPKLLMAGDVTRVSLSLPDRERGTHDSP
jgi:hypothetical protein